MNDNDKIWDLIKHVESMVISHDDSDKRLVDKSPLMLSNIDWRFVLDEVQRQQTLIMNSEYKIENQRNLDTLLAEIVFNSVYGNNYYTWKQAKIASNDKIDNCELTYEEPYLPTINDIDDDLPF